MKIAIPTRENQIDNHFGNCEYFTLIELNIAKEIQATEIMKSTLVCGCKSGLAGELAKKGVNLLLAGGIGSGAITKLEEHKINVISGFSGTIDEVIIKWKTQDYSREMKICTDHHNCSH